MDLKREDRTTNTNIDDLLYKVISTEKYEKTHRKKINEVKKDHTIQIEEIRTMHEVVEGEIVWRSRILYRNKKA